MDLTTLGARPEHIVNHFGTPERLDFFRAPSRGVPHWSETGFFEAYNPKANVGVFTHVGRCQQDLDLWWSHTLIFLPDGSLLADRSFGRSPDERQVCAGSSRILIEEPFKRWRSVFDGHGELTSTAGLAAAIRGHGPGVAVRYDVTGEALGPVWDLAADNAGAPPSGNWAGDGHYQQNFRTSGTLNVAGKEYRLDGVGWNDHSRGPRTFDNFGTHRWLSAILPGSTLHAITVWDAAGRLATAVGTLFSEGLREKVTVDFPGINDLVGGPLEYDIVVTRSIGEKILLRAKTLHAQMLTITGANDNLNGIHWPSDEGATCHFDSIVQLTTQEGATGYGHAERSARLSDLKRDYKHE